jgi:hypothetical protein
LVVFDESRNDNRWPEGRGAEVRRSGKGGRIAKRNESSSILLSEIEGGFGMKRFALTLIALGLVAGTALGQNNNPCPGDKEYQFNIIGVEHPKTTDMTNNNGHRIFVQLNGRTQIYMTGDTDPATTGLQCGNKFDVLDANGTDGSATILVPCDPLTATNLDPDVCFDVYATELGTPGGHTDVDVVCAFDATCLGCNIDGGDCALGNIDFSLAGHNGKPQTDNITSVFRATGCIDLGGVAGVCDAGDIIFRNEWIFNIEQLLYYYWDYDNQGNRVVQIRFCDTEDVPGACSGGAIVE